MALSINDIRQLAGNDSLLYDAQGGNLKSAGRWQNFKSIVGFGGARAQNAQTLAAIHHAILNDPQFFAKEVQDRAVELLSQVRTDRAIGAKQIRDIVTQLDALSAPSQRLDAARALVGARIAARGLPVFLPPAAGAEYLRLAKEEVVPQPEPPHGYGHVDYAAALDAFDAKIGGLFARIGN
ncbi:MAG: hypothetical protein IK066_02955, partial [Kiritimatiellae bacterium]|nr:hypothetical protein [Kiritimatiellia bacterium]